MEREPVSGILSMLVPTSDGDGEDTERERRGKEGRGRVAMIIYVIKRWQGRSRGAARCEARRRDGRTNGFGNLTQHAIRLSRPGIRSSLFFFSCSLCAANFQKTTIFTTKSEANRTKIKVSLYHYSSINPTSAHHDHDAQEYLKLANQKAKEPRKPSPEVYEISTIDSVRPNLFLSYC